MKQVIAALILMFLVGALFGTTAFTNAVEKEISGATERPLFTQYHALYQRPDFELNTFIDLKYKDNGNRFGIWDYLYPVTRDGRTVSIKREYSRLLKVYVRAAGTKDAEGRGKDRYFIWVETAGGSKAVYEVSREADFREILAKAVASHGRSDVVRDIIYANNLNAVKVYLPKPDPDPVTPVPTTCTNCRTLQLRIASLENTIEEMKRIAEEREAEIERLKWERKLMFFIAIVFFAVLVVVVIALLRVKSQRKQEQELPEKHKALTASFAQQQEENKKLIAQLREQEKGVKQLAEEKSLIEKELDAIAAEQKSLTEEYGRVTINNRKLIKKMADLESEKTTTERYQLIVANVCDYALEKLEVDFQGQEEEKIKKLIDDLAELTSVAETMKNNLAESCKHFEEALKKRNGIVLEDK